MSSSDLLYLSSFQSISPSNTYIYVLSFGSWHGSGLTPRTPMPLIINCEHDNRYGRSPIINDHVYNCGPVRTVLGVLDGGQTRAQPRDTFIIVQNGARIAHIFGQVCTLVHSGVLQSVFALHRGHQCLPWTMEVFLHLCHDAAAIKQRRAVRPGSLGPRGASRSRHIGQCQH